eukprot:2705819-Amphidinium_carterae.1
MDDDADDDDDVVVDDVHEQKEPPRYYGIASCHESGTECFSYLALGWDHFYNARVHSRLVNSRSLLRKSCPGSPVSPLSPPDSNWPTHSRHLCGTANNHLESSEKLGLTMNNMTYLLI